jgi:hypothetical protein
MGLSLGNTSIAEIYLGSVKVSEMYLGSSKVYGLAKKPYLVFEFSVSDFVPTLSLLNPAYRDIAQWTQVSSSPNRWKLTLNRFGNVSTTAVDYGTGLPFLFANHQQSIQNGYLISSNLGGGTCKLIDSGNLNITDSLGQTCETMDRMFMNCTGLTYIAPLHCTNVQNVGGMFQGCTEVTEGAYDQYVWFNTYGININNHSGTFTDCGSNTQTGTAELAQIPVGWGGTLVPASTLMTSTRQAYTSNRYTSWLITSGKPTWTDVKNGMYLFTSGSVAQFAGVSMNRSRIPNPINGLGTASGNALYFYPAFVQCTKVPGTSGNTVSWIVTTNTPNGNLTATQGNTDMPGTLDYGTYDPFAREYGTYDSSKDIYFTFLVTNVPIDQWGGLTDAMGFLYSTYFNADAGLRWFF